MKRWLCLLLCLSGLFCGCQSAPEAPDTTATTAETVETYPEGATVVGVCFPESIGIWADRFSFWEEALQELGYIPMLRDAQSDISLQIQQVKELINKVDLLVIAPVDSAMLCQTLESAQIPIIAYDNMLTDTDKVSFLVTFDYFQMGQAMGRELYSLANPQNTMELFMAQAEQESSLRYYQGLMDVLTPHIEDGNFTIPSGHLSFEDTIVPGGLPELAGQTMQRYLALHYTPPKTDEETTAPVEMPDFVIAGSDEIAQSCLAQLQDDCIVCGLGGTQTDSLSYSIRKDYAGLDDACLLAVQALLAGNAPETNFDGGMFNNAVNVPTWLGTYDFLYLAEETAA